MVAHGPTGTLEGQEERNRSQIKHIGESAALLAMVKPDVVMLAHTATSYTLGREAEAALVQRLRNQCGTAVATAFGSVIAALKVLGVTRLALGTPYSEETTLKGKALLEEHGLEVVSHGRLENVTNIYDETPERARALGRAVDTKAAEAVFLSGLGMPTISILDTLEQDLGKPAISAASATMWQALRLAGVRERVSGYGRLLASAPEPST
jgi:maleate isomerase